MRALAVRTDGLTRRRGAADGLQALLPSDTHARAPPSLAPPPEITERPAYPCDTNRHAPYADNTADRLPRPSAPGAVRLGGRGSKSSRRRIDGPNVALVIRFEREGEERFVRWIGGDEWRQRTVLHRLFAETETAGSGAPQARTRDTCDRSTVSTARAPNDTGTRDAAERVLAPWEYEQKAVDAIARARTLHRGVSESMVVPRAAMRVWPERGCVSRSRSARKRRHPSTSGPGACAPVFRGAQTICTAS